jgi:hypothetical protein
MNALDVFLREHAFVHTESVARSEAFNMDYLIEGMSEAQVRMQPHGMNSMAWLFWHVARVEDGFVSGIVMRRNQLFDEDKWGERLNVARRDFGTGMSKDDVAELSNRINLSALWDYRDSVGRRTQAMVRDLWQEGWTTPIEVTGLRRAADIGIFKPEDAQGMEAYLPGRSRESALMWWGLNHTLMHLGQVAMIRGIVTASTDGS